jgi:uncharacterized RDD family membrane protein YckC
MAGMPERIEFETPENVRVSYPLAGLGSRFIAWLVDWLILGVILTVVIIVLLIIAVTSTKLLDDFVRSLGRTPPGQPPEIPFYVFGFAWLLGAFGSLLYFGLSEYFWRGQTMGKRMMSLRVAKADGFSLDATSVFLRNIFRTIDQLPVLWVIPLLSARAQRLGDMVGGTVVVREEKTPWQRPGGETPDGAAAEPLYRFEPSALARATPTDVEAVRRLLERWGALKAAEREAFVAALCEPLARRLQVIPPGPAQRERFLRDFLAAHHHRQHRQLG